MLGFHKALERKSGKGVMKETGWSTIFSSDRTLDEANG